MTPREDFKLCFGIARQRAWREDTPDNLAGIPRRYKFAVERALYASDPYESKTPGRILRILREKRDPNSPKNWIQYNCRCTMQPIIPDDKTGS